MVPVAWKPHPLLDHFWCCSNLSFPVEGKNSSVSLTLSLPSHVRLLLLSTEVPPLEARVGGGPDVPLPLCYLLSLSLRWDGWEFCVPVEGLFLCMLSPVIACLGDTLRSSEQSHAAYQLVNDSKQYFTSSQ